MEPKNNDVKYIVVDEQVYYKKPKVKEFEKKKDATEYYLDLLDEGKNKTGEVTLYGKNGKTWSWLMQSRPSSISGRKKQKGV
jgi:hypothetical protein